jgi:hypothetical protein
MRHAPVARLPALAGRRDRVPLFAIGVLGDRPFGILIEADRLLFFFADVDALVPSLLYPALRDGA